MDAENPGSVWEAISDVVGRRDYDSLAAAVTAGIATPADKEMMQHRLRVALSYLDWTTPDGLPMGEALWQKAQPVLTSWITQIPLEARNQALYHYASSAGSYPRTCRLLVDCGADPYWITTHQDNYTSPPIVEAANFPGQEVYEMLEAMIGSLPVRTAEGLPPKIIHGKKDDGQWDRVDLLAYSAMTSVWTHVDWLRSRIDANSPAQEIFLRMGDLVLQKLRMNEDGSPQAGYPTIRADEEFTQQAARLLAAGVQFRKESLWEQTALRPVAHVSGSRGPFLFSLVDSASTLAIPLQVLNKALSNVLKHAPSHVDDYHPSSGRTPLMMAAAAGNPDRLIVLLEHGADPQKSERFSKVGETPRTAIDFAEPHPECKKMLLATVAKRATERVLEQARDRNNQEGKP